MAAPPTLSLRVEDFEDAGPETRALLERLLPILNRYSQDVASTLGSTQGATRRTATCRVTADGSGVGEGTFRSPVQRPLSVRLERLEAEAGGNAPPTGLSWRRLQGGEVGVVLTGLTASARYTLTLTVE